MRVSRVICYLQSTECVKGTIKIKGNYYFYIKPSCLKKFSKLSVDGQKCIRLYEKDLHYVSKIDNRLETT